MLQNLDKKSNEYIERSFNFKNCDDGIIGFEAFGRDEWVKFFNDGKASYSKSGKIADVIDFENYQDCVDFIMIKQ
jgi:pterin-4a-carbinolamine dehydratase